MRRKLTFRLLITVDVIVVCVRGGLKPVCGPFQRVCGRRGKAKTQRCRRYEARSTRAARWAIVARLINNIIHDWSNHLWRPSRGTCRPSIGRRPAGNHRLRARSARPRLSRPLSVRGWTLHDPRLPALLSLTANCNTLFFKQFDTVFVRTSCLFVCMALLDSRYSQ